jgi:hypothetical protein
MKKQTRKRVKKVSRPGKAGRFAPKAHCPIPAGWVRLRPGSIMRHGDKIAWPSVRDGEWNWVQGLAGDPVSDDVQADGFFRQLVIRQGAKRPAAPKGRRVNPSTSNDQFVSRRKK